MSKLGETVKFCTKRFESIPWQVYSAPLCPIINHHLIVFHPICYPTIVPHAHPHAHFSPHTELYLLPVFCISYHFTCLDPTFFLIYILLCFLVFAFSAGRKVKEEGAANDLLDRIAADALFAAVHGTLNSLLDPTLFVGRSPEQVKEFLEDCIDPILTTHASELTKKDVDAVNV